MKRRGPISAGELMDQLKADPEWVARAQDRERHRIVLEAEIRREEASLVDDLARRGISVSSVWDLVNSRDRYPAAIPVLLSHLSRTYRVEIKEGIARALGVKDARADAWEPILRMLDRETEPRVRDGLFVAISGMAGPTDVPKLISLLSERALGPSRIFLVRNLMRSKRSEARAALIAMEDDPDLTNEIRSRLRGT